MVTIVLYIIILNFFLFYVLSHQIPLSLSLYEDNKKSNEE